MELNPHVPHGPLEKKWDKRQLELKLVSPSNRRAYRILVVGSGLAGASAAASLAELGYRVACFCYQDSPRRAHSIAAQGGINAAKNYRNDGDSVFRLFHDTVRGGDFRSREAGIYRLAQLSNRIMDHCVAQGVPFTREYGGFLDTRSFGGTQVSRTFYARGQTGQQLLLGAYQALQRQIGLGQVEMFTRRDMKELIVVDGLARGIVARNRITGDMDVHLGDAVILATGGYGSVMHLATCAQGCNAAGIWQAYKQGAAFANPCFTQIHPTCIPVEGHYQSKLTLMSESLRNDGRLWVPLEAGDPRPPRQIPENQRDYFLERRYPAYGNLAPRDIASRAVKQICEAGLGVGETGLGVYLDLADALHRLGSTQIRRLYGNLFDMYERITGEDPMQVPMRIFPATHYTMGGLWVDYNLMSTLPGLFVLGEANFSDHGANRLGASALMQGLADGYFVAPPALGGYLAGLQPGGLTPDHPEARNALGKANARQKKLLSIQGTQSPATFHRKLGALLWETCGMSRNASDLQRALQELPELREQFWNDLRIPGHGQEINQILEHADRVADFLELAELMCLDALCREESCGAHFREEWQTTDGEALRDDTRFCHVAAWEYGGEQQPPTRHAEPLTFEHVPLAPRNYA